MPPRVKPPLDIQGEIMTPAECAAWLRIPELKLRRMIAANKVPAMKLSRKNIRLHRPSVLAALSN